ncbi:hypothetical protein H0H87_009704, partial [Tephrocybe sp. NHM501043]
MHPIQTDPNPYTGFISTTISPPLKLIAGHYTPADMTTCAKASTTQSGKLISSPPPSKQGHKRATSAVDTGSKAKKKKAEVAESSEEEQEEKKSHKNACKKSREAKKSKKSTNASTEPVHLTRAKQALVDQNISIVPPMRPCVAATVTSVTVASVPPVSVHPPVSACQRCLEAHTECAATVVEDMNSDSSSSDDDTQLACAHSHVPSDDSSVVSTKSGTLLVTVASGDRTPIDQRLESRGSSLTNEDMAKVNTALTISTGDHELGSTITPSATSAPVTPLVIDSSVIVTKPAS